MNPEEPEETREKFVEMDVDYCDESNKRWSVGVSCVVRVTLKDGSYHEDVGYGKSERQHTKGKAIEMAKKSGSSDALKRALRHYGQLLGLSVYDKAHVRDIKKKKAQPSNVAMNPNYQQQQPPIIQNVQQTYVINPALQNQRVGGGGGQQNQQKGYKPLPMGNNNSNVSNPSPHLGRNLQQQRNQRVPAQNLNQNRHVQQSPPMPVANAQNRNLQNRPMIPNQNNYQRMYNNFPPQAQGQMQRANVQITGQKRPLNGGNLGLPQKKMRTS